GQLRTAADAGLLLRHLELGREVVVEPGQPRECDRLGPESLRRSQPGCQSAACAAEIQAGGSDRPALEQIPAGEARLVFGHSSTSFSSEPASSIKTASSGFHQRATSLSASSTSGSISPLL